NALVNTIFEVYYRPILDGGPLGMARVPITVMGFRCDRCGHEWIPRKPGDEPRVCPKCHSPWWNKPHRRAMMPYDEFKEKIVAALMPAGKPLTWTEVRTVAGL